ncbi:hypothetical protein [Flagellimonas meridianipacifica]|uniref:Uncharacterized protein n=1 Tax=Flagellimonas meridianipacifica TaxID=1080225 RepID=A0A2T0MBK9_9FLAO|nr:hypothetical protein [Allomuricauda pacifica]PRX54865.1 hypothetical protein CLV81_3269 [Allomuricauda pacifica]
MKNIVSKGIKDALRLVFFSMVAFNLSCVGGKYTYQFDTGKKLDFSKGKWILNQTKSNSTFRYDKKLYNESFEQFKKILGDSLIDMTSLRNTSLVGPEIKMEPSQAELLQLHQDSNCDYLINLTGTVISEGAGSLSFNDPNSSYTTSNSSSVSIQIYDLKTGMIISSSRAFGKDTQENSVFEKEGALSLHSRAEPIMIQAAERLINKYNKYRIDK